MVSFRVWNMTKVYMSRASIRIEGDIDTAGIVDVIEVSSYSHLITTRGVSVSNPPNLSRLHQ